MGLSVSLWYRGKSYIPKLTRDYQGGTGNLITEINQDIDGAIDERFNSTNKIDIQVIKWALFRIHF